MFSAFLLLLATAAMANVAYVPTIDPSSVPMATRENWCVSQRGACPILCMQMANTTGATINTCEPKTLDFDCECTNGLSPNASQFSETIPYYDCTEANNQCVRKCSNSICQSECRTDNLCGAQSPKLVNVSTTTSASPAASTTAGSILTTSTATGQSSRLLASDSGQVYGFCVFVTGFLAGLAMIVL